MGRAGSVRAARAVASCLALVLVWLGMPALWLADPSVNAQDYAVARVPILVYHGIDYSGSEYSVTPEQLHAQAAWLVANGYTAVTLGHFWDAAMGYATLPANPVVLTNDDGNASALHFAEIIGQYGMVGTYFVNNVSYLTPEQIGTLSQWGAVEAHTVSHASLGELGYDAQLAEIADNKAYIEQITGQPVRFLAWPFGASNATAAQAAAAAGIVAAFGLGGTGCMMGAFDPYHVPRIMMVVSDDMETFAAKVSWW